MLWTTFQSMNRRNCETTRQNVQEDSRLKTAEAVDIDKGTVCNILHEVINM